LTAPPACADDPIRTPAPRANDEELESNGTLDSEATLKENAGVAHVRGDLDARGCAATA
jgi:hypothetical protein